MAEAYSWGSNEEIAGLGTEPVPAGPYYLEDYFELEREAVFRRTWLQVGHVCELPEPGSFIVREIEVAKASILIVRGTDGEIRAFHNVCVHRGTRRLPRQSAGQGVLRDLPELLHAGLGTPAVLALRDADRAGPIPRRHPSLLDRTR